MEISQLSGLASRLKVSTVIQYHFEGSDQKRLGKLLHSAVFLVPKQPAQSALVSVGKKMEVHVPCALNALKVEMTLFQ